MAGTAPARPQPALSAPLDIILALLLVAVPLLLGQQTTASVTQELGTSPELPNISGLEAPEKGESGPFRWGDEAVTMQLQPLGYPLYAVLTVQGVRPQGEPQAEIGAMSAGEALGTQVVPRSPITVEYRLPAAAFLSINPQITITSTTFQPPGDRRHLGVVFYRLEHRNGPGPSLPAPWPATPLLLSGALVLLAVRRLITQARLALIITGAWGVGIGLLNAVERPWLVFYSWYFPVLPVLIILTFPWFAGMWQRRHMPAAIEEAADHPNITANGWTIAITIVVAALSIMLWHLLPFQEPAGFNPTYNLSWGVSFYHALPLPLQILGIAAVLGSLIWAYFSPLSQTADKPKLESMPSNEAKGRNSKLPVWTPWALALGGMALFTLAPVAYSEGDASEFNEKIPKGAIWRERELLDFYFKARLWRLLQPIFSLPSDIYQLVAVFAGGVYMAGCSLVGRTLGRDRSEALFIIGALAAIGNIMFFFRYIETYATVTAISVFVLWACWRYTEGHLSFGSVGALATLAPFIHGSALWWGPMVVVAWLVRTFRQPVSGRWRLGISDLREGVGVGAAVSLLVISILLIDGYDYERLQVGMSEMGGGDGNSLIQLFQTKTHFEYFTYFSLPHLGAVIQEQLLVAPLALVTVVIVLCAAWRGVRKLAAAVPSLIALFTGAAGMLFFTISWNPDLGPRNDWDLLALSALPLTLLAAFLLLHLPPGRPRRIALTAYLSVSAVHAAAWVLLHVLGIAY